MAGQTVVCGARFGSVVVEGSLEIHGETVRGALVCVRDCVGAGMELTRRRVRNGPGDVTVTRIRIYYYLCVGPPSPVHRVTCILDFSRFDILFILTTRYGVVV